MRQSRCFGDILFLNVVLVEVVIVKNFKGKEKRLLNDIFTQTQVILAEKKIIFKFSDVRVLAA